MWVNNKCNETSRYPSETVERKRRMVASTFLMLFTFLLALGGLVALSKPAVVLSMLLPRPVQSTRVPQFVKEIRDLSGGPPSFQQSTALAKTLERRTETISTTGVGALDNTTVVALAQADWYFQSGQDLSGLYRGRPLQIAEGHVLAATRRMLQQRGARLPITTWTARLQNGSTLTGRVPPPSWAQSPPSDTTLQGHIGLARRRISEQVPDLVRTTRNGAILRPMEAALVAYVFMTNDNGWIGTRRAQIDLTPQEARSFMSDLGIQIPVR